MPESFHIELTTEQVALLTTPRAARRSSARPGDERLPLTVDAVAKQIADNEVALANVKQQLEHARILAAGERALGLDRESRLEALQTPVSAAVLLSQAADAERRADPRLTPEQACVIALEKDPSLYERILRVQGEA